MIKRNFAESTQESKSTEAVFLLLSSVEKKPSLVFGVLTEVLKMRWKYRLSDSYTMKCIAGLAASKIDGAVPFQRDQNPSCFTIFIRQSAASKSCLLK